MFLFDELPNELMVMVFEQLSASDRLLVECVCLRWNILAKECSWSQYRELSLHHQFPGSSVTKHVPTFKELECLFRRCGRHLCKLDAFGPLDYDGNIGNLLMMLDNLKHLNAANVFMDKRSQDIIADRFANTLKSASFEVDGMDSESFSSLRNVLSNCQNIEVLRIRRNFDTGGLKFHRFPSSLKFFEFDDAAYCTEFFDRISEQKIKLKGLSFRCAYLDEQAIANLRRIDSSRLEYFAVHLGLGAERAFSLAVVGMPELRALELTLHDGLDMEDIIRSIIECCPKMEHLKLQGLSQELYGSNSFYRLANLSPRLCSVSIQFRYSESKVYVGEFFKQLSFHGRLKYFCTNGTLSIHTVCQALMDCRDLNHLFWDVTGFSQEHFLCFMNIIHAGELPNSPIDDRILRMCFYELAVHPWIMNLERGSNKSIPTSSVLRSICGDEFSSTLFVNSHEV